MLKLSRKSLIIVLVFVIIIWLSLAGLKFLNKHLGESESLTLPSTEETELAINTDISDIFISKANGNDINIFSERSGGLETNTNGNSITIEQANRRFFANGYITIELPKGIKSLIVKTKTGDIDIASIDAKEISLSTTTGDIEITDLTSDSISISSNDGDAEISNSTFNNKLDITLADGELDLENIDSKIINADILDGNIDISNGYYEYLYANANNGNIDIYLQDKNAEVNYKNQSGNTYLFEERYKKEEDKAIFGSGKIKLNLTVNNGNIEVK